MIQKIWRPFFLLLSSLSLFLPPSAQACAGWYEKESPNCLFLPQLSKGNPNFYYTQGALHGYFDVDGANLSEWKGYFQNKVEESVLSYLVFSSSVHTIDSLIQLLNSPEKNAQRISQSVYLQFAPPSKLLTFYTYLLHAKHAEPVFTSDFSWWDSPEEIMANNQNKLANIPFEKAFYECKDTFIKQRYGFQLMRLFYHTGLYEKGIAFYDKHLQTLQASFSISKRTLGFKAACLYKLEQYQESNIVYATLFDFMPNAAMWSFHVEDEAEWEATLKKTKDKETKIKLWFMMGYYLDPLRGLEEIYKLDPQSPHLRELATRAINIQEEEALFSSNLSYYSPLQLIDDFHEVEDLFAFLEKVCREKKSNELSFWYIATGHTAILMRNNVELDMYSVAETYFKKAENLKIDELEKQQIRISRFIIFLQNSPLLADDEMHLYEEIKWIQSQSLGISEFYYEYRENFDLYVFTLLTEKYEDKGLPIFSELCSRLSSENYYGSSPFYADIQNTILMLDFFSKPHKSVWEAYLIEKYPFKAHHLIEWQILQLIYSQNYDAAHALAKANPESMVAELWGDPFSNRLKDCHDCDHANEHAPSYSKLAFFEKLIALKKEVDNGVGDIGSSAALLGNAFYNMSYYGNARAFYYNPLLFDLGYGDAYGFEYSSYNFDQNNPISIWSMQMSKNYYEIALKLLKKKEQRAQICWMLAKCNLNEFYNGEVESEQITADFIAGPYMVLFAKEYNNTKYYKEAIKECGYFRTYLSNQKKKIQ